MKKIFISLFTIFMAFIWTSNISALTITETPDEEDTYDTIEDGTMVLGITKFESDVILTAKRVSTATFNDVMFNYGKPNYEGIEIYYFLMGDWYIIGETNVATLLDIDDADDALKIRALNNSDIYYVNNEEKILELEWDFPNEEGIEFTFKTNNSSKDDAVVVENGKLKIPATVKRLEAFINEVGSEEKISLFNIAKENDNDIEFDEDTIKGSIESDPHDTGKVVGGEWDLQLMGNLLTIYGDIGWYPADAELGRVAGNRVGVQITAPTGYTAEQVADAVVKYDGNTYRWGTVKDGENYLLLYPLVDSEYEMFTVEITWVTGNTQTFTIVVEGELEEPATVSFNTSGGSVIQSTLVKPGDAVAEPLEDPTKTDYVFIEWQLNGSTYDFDTVVNANTELVALWEPEWFNTANLATDVIYTIDKAEKLTYLLSHMNEVNNLAKEKSLIIKINAFETGVPTIEENVTIGDDVTLEINTPTVLNADMTMNGTLKLNSKISGTGKMILNGVVYNSGIADLNFKIASTNATIYTPWGEEWFNFAGGTASTNPTFALAQNSEFKLNEVTEIEATRGAIDVEFVNGTATLLSSGHISTPGAIVTIGENAEFVVAEGKAYYNYGKFIVNGTATINGTFEDFNDVTKGLLQTIWSAASFTNDDLVAGRGISGTGIINLNGNLKVNVGASGIELTGVTVNTNSTGKFYIKSGDTSYEYIGSTGIASLSAESTMSFKTNESNGFTANIKTGTFTINSANGMDPINYPTSFFVGAVDELNIASGATIAVNSYTVLNGKITGTGTLTINNPVAEGADLLIINDYETQNKLGAGLTINGTGTYERRNP